MSQKITIIHLWPNGLGATASRGRRVIEVFEHGGAAILRRDNSLCGSYRTHWARLPKSDLQTMADAALSLPLSQWNAIGGDA